jgi:hypothetical protein
VVAIRDCLQASVALVSVSTSVIEVMKCSLGFSMLVAGWEILIDGDERH